MMRRQWTTEDAILNGGPLARSVCNVLLNREVRVTKQMIRDGCKEQCRSCPVALAILAVLPWADVRADYSWITVEGVRFLTPEEVTRFMGRFDYTTNRESMNGIRFTLTETIAYYWRPKKSSV